MSKQKLLTAAGITLSFVIAIGGWVFTSTLIDMRSDALLSQTGVTLINSPATATATATATAPALPDNSGDDVPDDRTSLSEHEIVSILYNWESNGREIPHEPTDGQINMEQAIEIAQAGLSSFVEQGLFHPELLELSLSLSLNNAYLSQKVQESNRFHDPVYSYWTVVFTGESIRATLTVNAVTGQIWKCDILATNTPPIELNVSDMKNILDVFLSNVGINDEEEITISADYSEPMAVKRFANGNAFAVVKAGTGYGWLGDDGLFSTRGIILFLTTQEPALQ